MYMVIYVLLEVCNYLPRSLHPQTHPTPQTSIFPATELTRVASSKDKMGVLLSEASLWVINLLSLPVDVPVHVHEPVPVPSSDYS